MRIIIADDYEDLSRRAARLLVDLLGSVQKPVVVLPTGNTPLGMYRELLKLGPVEREMFSDAGFIQLDEYAGIDEDDWRSLAGWLRRSFLDEADISPSAVTNFQSSAPDRAMEAGRMERAIGTAGGIDVSVLGIGLNGHIGFNEPGSTAESPTRVVQLTPQSVRSNAAYWGGEAAVPRYAYTLGLGILSRARQTVLLVSGAAKAQILGAALEGPITPEVPATFLHQLRDVTVIADREAAAAVTEQT
jgi:glucosamine-6-phosphate deaminase